MVPAWQRYDGALFRAGRQALLDLARSGCHIVILSGGYGALLAGEPIGQYDQPLRLGWWPNRILERVLIAYAKRHKLSCVRAFASARSSYRVILGRVGWSEAGIGENMLLTPWVVSGQKSPACIGQVLVALRYSALTSHWRSSGTSGGLGLDVYTT